MKEVRVRYAPSPTGYLHIGNARTALFNYLFTKHNNGKMIIRIEDTDVERNIVGGEKSQLDNLKWLGITWDESIDVSGPHEPYNQLKRHEIGLYTPFVEQLLSEKKAYKCFCSSEQLDIDAEEQKANGEIPKYNGRCRHLSEEQVNENLAKDMEYSIRFAVPANTEITWNDIVKNNITFNSSDVSGDFNIVKRNGIPTYNFAVVVDDHLMEISHVLRGEDHISNTPKQIMLYNAMNMEVPTFAHMTLIVNETGKKLSKRDTTIVQFIEDYKKLGYLPEALFNFIALLGWSPNSEEEIFSVEQLIEEFDVNRLSKSSAKFDVNKLSWINNQYIKKMENEAFFDLVMPFVTAIENSSKYTNEQLNSIALLYKDQISFGAQMEEVSSLFFKDFVISSDAKAFLEENNSDAVITEFKNLITECEELSAESIKAMIKTAGKNAEVKGKMLFMPIRIATTGQMHGPELADALVILGKEAVINNINNVL